VNHYFATKTNTLLLLTPIIVHDKLWFDCVRFMETYIA